MSKELKQSTQALTGRRIWSRELSRPWGHIALRSECFKRFGDVVALETVDLDIHEGEYRPCWLERSWKDNIASSPLRCVPAH